MELMDIKKTAVFLCQTEPTIRAWLHNKVIPYEVTIKMGRRRLIIKEKLEEFLTNKTEEKRNITNY